MTLRGGTLSCELSRDARSQRSSHHNARRLTRGPRVLQDKEKRRRRERKRKTESASEKNDVSSDKKRTAGEARRRREGRKQRDCSEREKERKESERENDGKREPSSIPLPMSIRPCGPRYTIHCYATTPGSCVSSDPRDYRRTERENRYDPAALRCAAPSVTGSFSQDEPHRRCNDCANRYWRKRQEILFRRLKKKLSRIFINLISLKSNKFLDFIFFFIQKNFHLRFIIYVNFCRT